MADYSRQSKYAKKTYEQIVFHVHKGYKDDLKAYASERNLSLNGLITQAIEAYTGMQVGKKKQFPSDEAD